jgi:hypothetical protein
MNKRSKARGTTNVNLEREIQTVHVIKNVNLIGTKKTGTASVFDIALTACFRSNQKRLCMRGAVVDVKRCGCKAIAGLPAKTLHASRSRSVPYLC